MFAQLAHRYANAHMVAAFRQSTVQHQRLLGHCSLMQWLMSQAVQTVTIGMAPFKAGLPIAIVISGCQSWGIRCRVVCKQVSNAAQAVIPFCLYSLSKI